MSTTRVVLACLSALILNCHVPRMEAQAYCEEHQRNESVCPWCNADYVSELGICPEHGWQEAFCFRCHADLEPGFRAQGDWCVEHALPESQCDACGAQVPKLDLASNLPIETACPSVASVIVLPNVETIRPNIGNDILCAALIGPSGYRRPEPAQSLHGISGIERS